jgi:energy-coupling factor transport system substrate-specific component
MKSIHRKWQIRDLVTIGIFSALFFVIFLVCLIAFGWNPLIYLFFPALVSFLCATVFLLLVTKVKKTGTIFIFSLLNGLIFLLLGYPHLLAAILAGGLIAELLVAGSAYQKLGSIVAGYAVIMTSIAFGIFGPLYFWAEWYIQRSIDGGAAPEYMAALSDYVSLWVLSGILLMTAVGTLLGMLVARRMLRKHFEKAGMVRTA